LWEQLSEGENREKVLKLEIEKAHNKVASQDQVIEKLKDEMKKIQRDNLKLLQYKTSKSKRIDDLEVKAREFEVLQGLDIHKLLGLLEK